MFFDPKEIGYILKVTAVLGLALAFAAGIGVGAALAHDWYDFDCCDNKDCFEIPEAEVTQTSDGYVWTNDNGSELFKFGSEYLRISQDGGYHGCEVTGDIAHDTFKRCLYIPAAF